jgi:hypothetical protein
MVRGTSRLVPLVGDVTARTRLSVSATLHCLSGPSENGTGLTQLFLRIVTAAFGITKGGYGFELKLEALGPATRFCGSLASYPSVSTFMRGDIRRQRQAHQGHMKKRTNRSGFIPRGRLAGPAGHGSLKKTDPISSFTGSSRTQPPSSRDPHENGVSCSFEAGPGSDAPLRGDGNV